MRRKKWWRRSPWCWFGKHQWLPYEGIRLMRLDDSWPPVMADGLPSGKRFDCPGCGLAEVKPFPAKPAP